MPSWLALFLLGMAAAHSVTAVAQSDAGSGQAVFKNPAHAPRAFGPEARGQAVLKYLVMGDSTAAGQGADYEQGIAVGTARALAAARPLTLVNVAVSGARAADVVSGQLPLALEYAPDITLLSISANDVTHLTPISSAQSDIEKIVAALRIPNPCMAIVLTGAPDMGAPPRIPFGLRWLAGRRSASFNAMFRELATRLRVTLAPIADRTGPLFRADHSLFADDGFHPNDRGYAAWMAVLNPALSSALRQRASCLGRPRE